MLNEEQLKKLQKIFEEELMPVILKNEKDFERLGKEAEDVLKEKGKSDHIK